MITVLSQPRCRRPRALLATGAVTLAALVGLSGCGIGNVEPEDIEDSITEAMDEQGVTVSEVSCPEGLPAEVDATVVCDVQLEGMTAGGSPIDRIRVVATEVDGNEVRYRLEPLGEGVPEDEPAPDEESSTEG